MIPVLTCIITCVWKLYLVKMVQVGLHAFSKRMSFLLTTSLYPAVGPNCHPLRCPCRIVRLTIPVLFSVVVWLQTLTTWDLICFASTAFLNTRPFCPPGSDTLPGDLKLPVLGLHPISNGPVLQALSHAAASKEIQMGWGCCIVVIAVTTLLAAAQTSQIISIHSHSLICYCRCINQSVWRFFYPLSSKNCQTNQSVRSILIREAE